MFTVAIIGRANVGKSTLFNCLAKKKAAIVHNYPGVTRDRKEEQVEFLGLKFNLIDTAGYESEANKLFARDLIKQINFAVDNADLLLFLLDAKAGITAEDYDFVNYIRKKNKDIILVINKAESKQKSIDSNEILKIGFKNIVYLSAEHRIGFQDLFTELNYFYQKYQNIYADIEESYINDKGKIRVAIVGKPNVGKSTFINALLKEDRLLVADHSGTTRDAINIDWHYKGKDIILVDTAGIRKRSKIIEKLEKLSYEDSLKAIRFANICVLLFDATQKKLEKQDLAIISHIIDEGRGLVIAINKVDLLKQTELKELFLELEYQITKYASSNKYIKIYAVSAKTGQAVEQVLNVAINIYDNWNLRVDTNSLNRWLNYVVVKHTPPLYKGKDHKFKYITQIKTRPPTFVIMTNYPDKIPESYITYLKKSLVDNFALSGVNPRLIFKKNKNPYSGKQGSKSIKK